MTFQKGNKLWDNDKSRANHFKKGTTAHKETQFKKGHVPWSKGRIGLNSGSENPSWKGGVSARRISEKKHLCSKYKAWMLAVKKRDNWKCKMTNCDCKGRLEAHHILNWIDYPELRYELNNGITLCQAHHPRGRAKEKRLIPTFLELVSVSNL